MQALVDKDKYYKDITPVKDGKHELGVSTTVTTSSLPLNVNSISGSNSYDTTAAADARGG